MKLDHWKNYEPIESVTTFDANSAGPTLTNLQVIANAHASDAYPEARIGFVIANLGSVMLTLEQSAALRGHLAARIGAAVVADHDLAGEAVRLGQRVQGLAR